jgi:hypothetical protein
MAITYFSSAPPTSKPLPDTTVSESSKPTSFALSLISGALGGAAGGYSCFPFEGLKKRLQRGELISSDFFRLNNGKLIRAIHPRELFRGSTPFAGCVGLASAISISFHNCLKKVSFYDPNSDTSKAIAAFACGMFTGAFVSTPIENMILIQQARNVSPTKAIKIMLDTSFLRPFVSAPELMVREGLFTGVMLWGGDAAYKKVKEVTGSDKLALIGMIGAGILGTALSHPSDTLATEKQKHNGKTSLMTNAKTIYDLHGIRGFYKGFVPRIFLFTGCAVSIKAYATFIENKLANNI